MSNTASHSRMRIALAQYLIANKFELEDLYACLGVEPSAAEESALSHITGVIDGMNLAANRIRTHGLDDWAKAN